MKLPFVERLTSAKRGEVFMAGFCLGVLLGGALAVLVFLVLGVLDV